MTWQNIKEGMTHIFIVLVFWAGLGGADALQGGDYRASFGTLIIVALLWGWWLEHERANQWEQACRWRREQERARDLEQIYMRAHDPLFTSQTYPEES